LGLELKNATPEELSERNTKFGVLVRRSLKPEFTRYDLQGILITHINDQPMKNIEQVQDILNQLANEDPIKVSFVGKNGEKSAIIFR